MENYYTSEENILQLITLLKAHGVRKVVASREQQILHLLEVYRMILILKFILALMKDQLATWLVDYRWKAVNL